MFAPGLSADTFAGVCVLLLALFVFFVVFVCVGACLRCCVFCGVCAFYFVGLAYVPPPPHSHRPPPRLLPRLPLGHGTPVLQTILIQPNGCYGIRPYCNAWLPGVFSHGLPLPLPPPPLKFRPPGLQRIPSPACACYWSRCLFVGVCECAGACVRCCVFCVACVVKGCVQRVTTR